MTQSYIHKHRQFWTDRIKAHIKESKKMGSSYSLSIKFQNEKKHKKFYIGSYDIFLNNRYVTCVLINKDDNLLNSKKLAELELILTTTNRTIELLEEFKKDALRKKKEESYKNKYLRKYNRVAIKV
jgi:hypothetical protein